MWNRCKRPPARSGPWQVFQWKLSLDRNLKSSLVSVAFCNHCRDSVLFSLCDFSCLNTTHLTTFQDYLSGLS
jgi:hypothetical protein